MMTPYLISRFKSIKNNRGMISIEAAVIIPITLAITMLIIWLGIYYYDLNAVEEASGKAAVMGSHIGELDNNEIQDLTAEALDDLLKENLIMVEDTNYDISVEYGLVTIHVTGSLNVPSFFLFGDIYQSGFWNIDITCTCPRIRPSMFIRTINNIKNGGNTDDQDR